MPIPPIVIVVNAIFLVATFVLAFIVLRAGARYRFYYGDPDKQIPMKWLTLRTLVVLVLVGLAAAIFNLFFTG